MVNSRFNALNADVDSISCTQGLMSCSQQLHSHRGKSTDTDRCHMTAVKFSQGTHYKYLIQLIGVRNPGASA